MVDVVSRGFVDVVAAVKLAFVIVFLPAYVVLIWLFARHPIFKSNIVYHIMLHMGIMNCFHLVTTAYACVMDYAPTAFYFYAVMACSYLRYSHTWAIPLLNLILAANRLLVILRLSSAKDAVTKASVTEFEEFVLLCSQYTLPLMSVTQILFNVFHTSIYLVWATVLTFPVLFYISKIEATYKVHVHSYTHEEQNPLAVALTYFSLSINAATLLAYVALVAGIAYQRFLYNKATKISSVEGRVILQAVLTFVLFSGTATAGNYFPEEASPYVTTIFAAFLVMIPCFVFLIHVGFNPLVRHHFVNFLLPGKSVSSSHVFHVDNTRSKASNATRRSSILPS
ncbi:hypothetical protein QR680_009865 [Steinernema hermaphroditum]|uniref:Uncharacterized protein n=1 Tax=Steinernema hermaphroditum TaxID=289476 RepID=A0AA39MAI0_9BILA|nr:hypothetical protein QR680_009865 [Steinernema hermaphroditum]